VQYHVFVITQIPLTTAGSYQERPCV